MKNILQKNIRFFGAAVLLLFSSHALSAEEIVYPLDVGIIDVTKQPWNFDNTGVEDITGDLQSLIDQTIPNKFPNGGGGYRIIYFPDGTYRLSDTVIGHYLNFGAAGGGIIIQGQSRDGVVLRLDDNAAGFDNPDQPKVLLNYMEGNSTNNAFMNMLENLTIDVGSGNPGAVAVRFHANNTGAVRKVKLISSDPAKAGAAGLEAVKRTNGPWMIRGLEVDGFDYGLNVGNAGDSRHVISIQDLVLRDQKVAGVALDSLILNFLNCHSSNSVPFLIEESENSLVNLIDCELISPEGSQGSAILSNSAVYLREITQAGYATVVSDGNGPLLAAINPDEEWYSHPRNALWEETSTSSLNLPIEQAPELPWPADPADWSVVPSPNGEDDTEAVREALHDGPKMVIFQPGTYRISETLRIPPHVERIACQWARFNLNRDLDDGTSPLFEWGPSDHPVVLIERLRTNFGQLNPNPLILNAGTGTLVLRDIFYVTGALYRGEPTRGKVFMENIHGLPGNQDNYLSVPSTVIRGQEVWAYQWNPEQLFPHAVVDGGQFFMFGGKTGETRGPIVDARNHAFAELFGVSMNLTHDSLDIDPADTIMFQSEEANIAVNVFEHAQLTGGGRGWGRHQLVAVETRNGERRELSNDDPSVIRSPIEEQIGALIPLYTGYFDQDNPANQTPIVGPVRSNLDATGNIYSFRIGVFDPDAYPAEQTLSHMRAVSGPGIVRMTRTGPDTFTVQFEREGIYELEISATDGALASAKHLPLKVSPKMYSTRLGLYDVYRYIDNFPQDGVADTDSFGFLQVGDDASNNHTHLSLEFDLKPLAGMAGRIASANLSLRIDAINGLDSVSVAHGTNAGFGLADSDDFELPRQNLGSVSLVGKTPGDRISVDILEAIEYGLQEGFEFLTVWLTSEYTNNDVEESVIFTSTALPDESLHPLLMVRAFPVSLVDSAVSIGEDYFYSPIYGSFYDFGEWIYHDRLAWLYQAVEGNSSASMYLYSFEKGWLYTADSLFPWTYSFSSGNWELL